MNVVAFAFMEQTRIGKLNIMAVLDAADSLK
jgi:hypothetical protein